MIHVVCFSPSRILNAKLLTRNKYFSTVHIQNVYTCNLKVQKTMLDNHFFIFVMAKNIYLSLLKL